MVATATAQPYPVRVDASLDAPLSRWVWLVKWMLVVFLAGGVLMIVIPVRRVSVR